MSKNTGFTLMELLIAIVILAILAGFAAPSFVKLSANNQLSAQVNRLNGAISAARSEAVKRKTQVTLTPLGTGWNSGWTVSVGAGADKEDLLKSSSEYGKVYIQTGSSSNALVFTSNGYTSTAKPWGDSGVTLCNPDKNGRNIQIQRSGSVKITQVTCS